MGAKEASDACFSDGLVPAYKSGEACALSEEGKSGLVFGITGDGISVGAFGSR